jgi:hypothetical protein
MCRVMPKEWGVLQIKHQPIPPPTQFERDKNKHLIFYKLLLLNKMKHQNPPKKKKKTSFWGQF